MIVSPIVEACPGTNKGSRMSMLHSFYCWGHMAVVLLSTLYFTLAGIENWRLLPPLWALVPLFTLFAFTKVPIYAIPGDDEETRLPKSIFRIKVFWILFFVMIFWTLLLCFLYGPQPFPLRHERRESEADPFPEGYQPSVYPWLPGHFPFAHPPSVPGGLRYLRILRGTDVARYLLPGSRLFMKGRHFYVRHVRHGRRHRLFCRSGRGRDHLPVYRKNESWDPYCHSLPVRNADTGIPLETSEAGIKAGYLIRNN